MYDRHTLSGLVSDFKLPVVEGNGPDWAGGRARKALEPNRFWPEFQARSHIVPTPSPYRHGE
jgi:hypothetical protein